MREAAHGLAARGWEVDVLTTCARDHYTWANEYPPGVTTVDGVAVHRFPVEAGNGGPRARADRGEHPRTGSAPPMDEQLDVARRHCSACPRCSITSSSTPTATTRSCSRRISGGRPSSARRSRPSARSSCRACTTSRTRASRCCTRCCRSPRCCGSSPSPSTSSRTRIAPLPARHVVTGAGVPIPTSYDADGFRERHGIERPFVLFAGRREGGKGWDWLLDAYQFAVDNYDVPLDLVTSGVGPVGVPDEHRRPRHRPRVPRRRRGRRTRSRPRPRTCSRARNESFSRTVDGSVAGAHARARDRAQRGAALALRTLGRRTAVQRRVRVRAVPRVRRRGARSPPTRWRSAGASTCSTNYRWDVVLDAMEALARGPAVKVLVVGPYPAAVRRRRARDDGDRAPASRPTATRSRSCRSSARPRTTAARSRGVAGALDVWRRGPVVRRRRPAGRRRASRCARSAGGGRASRGSSTASRGASRCAR